MVDMTMEIDYLWLMKNKSEIGFVACLAILVVLAISMFVWGEELKMVNAYMPILVSVLAVLSGATIMWITECFS